MRKVPILPDTQIFADDGSVSGWYYWPGMRPVKRAAPFFQPRYGRMTHRTRAVTTTATGTWLVKSWCGVQYLLHNLDPEHTGRFTDRTDAVCHKCDERATRLGQPSAANLTRDAVRHQRMDVVLVEAA